MHDRQLRSDNPLLQKVGPARPEFETQRCSYNAAQLRDAGKSEFQRRSELLGAGRDGGPNSEGSRMVKTDRPHPQLRPGPGLAYSVDRAVHFARLDQERGESRPQQAAPARNLGAVSREAFMAQRSAQSPKQSRSKDRDR